MTTRSGTRHLPTGTAGGAVLGDKAKKLRIKGFKPSPRTPPAARSHLGLAWRCVRRGRAGVGAEQDCIELAVELGEPLVLFLESLPAPPAFGYSRCSIA